MDRKTNKSHWGSSASAYFTMASSLSRQKSGSQSWRRRVGLIPRLQITALAGRQPSIPASPSEFAVHAAHAWRKQEKYQAFDLEQLKRDMQDPAVTNAIARNRALRDHRCALKGQGSVFHIGKIGILNAAW
ncbi:hypothetical protein [Mesorhizobium tamadayense]|uniref:hypothetical protein n=1 Tax=Mesorhizobium tamadayense TaxID=425306 RepID=UPI001FDF3B9B|nr:hypothetical protein [Mesorhizobium tamadayense]